MQVSRLTSQGAIIKAQVLCQNLACVITIRFKAGHHSLIAESCVASCQISYLLLDRAARVHELLTCQVRVVNLDVAAPDPIEQINLLPES